MRVLALLSVGATAVALPASASTVEPKVIVLRQADVPSGYVVDGRQSLVTPNELLSSPPALRKVVAQSGRVTGYRRVFRYRGSDLKVINAGVDVFRSPAGAQRMLSWHDARQRKDNAKRGVIRSYGRESAGIGRRSWVYWSGAPHDYVLVVWTSGRVLGYLVSWELGKQGTLTLARTQQRRIAAALR